MSDALQARVQAYVDLTRPYNALPAMLAFLCGYVFGAQAFDGWLLLTGLLIVALTHSATTVWNDLKDAAIDRVNKRRSGLLDGAISPKQATSLTIALYAAALVMCTWSPDRADAFGYFVAYLLMSWLYNDRPFRLSFRPILSVVVLGICYGYLPFVFGSGGPQSTYIIVLGLLWLLQRSSISIMKDFKDRVGDQKLNKRTFLLRFGTTPTIRTSITLALLAYGGVLMIASSRADSFLATALFALAILLALLNLKLRISLFKSTDDTKRNQIFQKSFMLQNASDISVLLCLISR